MGLAIFETFNENILSRFLSVDPYLHRLIALVKSIESVF